MKNINISVNRYSFSAMTTRSLKILALADLHDRTEMLEPLRSVDADLIAFCGDLHDGSSLETAWPTANALAGLGRPVLIVPGNMDHKDVAIKLWREAGFIMLHRSTFEHENCGFLGMGGMVARNPRRLGDGTRYYHQDEEVYQTLAKVFPMISNKKFKIIITHQPPRGARDTLYNGERSGSVSLRRFVEEFQPDLLLCGHIHEDRGEACIGSTKIVNVGELRRGYASIIKLDDEIAVEWLEP